MIKKICFFSRGFAFNRQNRLKYYESIFPSNVEIFLFTTDKYKGQEKEKYQHEWDLKRTKVFVENYNPLTLPFKIRTFCKKHGIKRVVNLGNWLGATALFASTRFSNVGYIVNILADVIPRQASKKGKIVRKAILLPLLFFSKKTIFNDESNYLKYKKIFGDKIKYLPATVNTDLFKPIDKIKARKMLKLQINKRIVIFVGRVDYTKGADLLVRLIKSNKDLTFIVIGRSADKKFDELKSKKPNNLIYFEKKSSEELVLYYSAADLGYFPQRIEGGLGMTTAECMASGVPAINRDRDGIPESPALFKTPVDFDSANNEINNFFKKSERERQSLKKIAREYAEKHYSQRGWKKRYISYHLD